jgi:hypothetical protein
MCSREGNPCCYLWVYRFNKIRIRFGCVRGKDFRSFEMGLSFQIKSDVDLDGEKEIHVVIYGSLDHNKNYNLMERRKSMLLFMGLSITTKIII